MIMALIGIRLQGKCEPFSVCQDTGLHYDRYLREVIEYLEKDPHFREKLKNTNMDDIKVRAPFRIPGCLPICLFALALEFKLCRGHSSACSKGNFPKSWTLFNTTFEPSWTS